MIVERGSIRFGYVGIDDNVESDVFFDKSDESVKRQGCWFVLWILADG
jgi:hypothetical protein